MMCLDCNKTRQYPVIDRKTDQPICPVCFGSDIHNMAPEDIAFARSQRWYFKAPEVRATMVVVPVVMPKSDWWLGYIVNEGGKFQLVPIGSEGKIDRMIGYYKATGGIMRLPLKLGQPGDAYEEVQVHFAVKLKADESFISEPRASEVINV